MMPFAIISNEYNFRKIFLFKIFYYNFHTIKNIIAFE